jgi:Retrotransposon gag protein
MSSGMDPSTDATSLLALIHDLQSKLAALETSGSTSPPTSSSRNIKTTKPDTFHGIRSKLRSFVSQLAIYFALQPADFTTDVNKIMFAASLLRDSAFDWFEPNLRKRDSLNPPEILTSYSAFLASLESTFGDVDAKATAERQLRSLRQTSSASAYSTSFQQIVSFLEWDDAALGYAFYNGLKDSVKDELAKDDRPASLTALMEKAIKIDNRQFERSREKQASLARSNLPTSATQQRFNPSHLVQVPVRSFASPLRSEPRSFAPQEKPIVKQETSTSTVTTNLNLARSLRSSGKLPDTERAFRLQNNLCLYCGQSGHSVKNCPTLQQRNQSLSGTNPSSQSGQLLDDGSPSASDTDYSLISLDYASESQHSGNHEAQRN